METGVKLLTSLITDLPAIITELAVSMPEIITGMVEALSEGISDFAEIGTNLVKGLWNGIDDAVDWIIEKIKGFGSAVIKEIKGIFGIASPSKVMRDEVGKYLAEGIGVGFEDEMNTVNKQIRDAIDTDFNVNADVLSSMRGNPAYTAAAVKMPTAGAGNNNSILAVSYGDFVINGNATEDTVEAFRAALRENSEYIQELVYDRHGMKKVQNRLTIQRKQMDEIGFLLTRMRG